MEKIIAWGKAHPYMLGGLVFGVGILLLWWFGFFSRGTQQSSGVSDYYAAETAGAVAAGQLAQSNNATEAAIAGIQAGRDVALQQSSDSVQVAGIQASRDTQITGISAARDTQIASIGGEVADAQTAASLANGLAYIDYLTRASSDALSAHIADVSAAVTTSTEAAQVASQQINASLQVTGLNDSLAAYVAEVGMIENYNADITAMGNSTGQGLNAAQPNSPPPWDASLFFTPTPNASSTLPLTFVPADGSAPSLVTINPALSTVPMSNGPTATDNVIDTSVLPTGGFNILYPASPPPPPPAASTYDATIKTAPAPAPVTAPTVSYFGKG